MTKLLDEQGNEVEALMPEEAEQKAREAADAAAKEAQEHAEKAQTELQAQISEKDKEIEKLRGQDRNFANAREKINEKEEEKRALESRLGEMQKTTEDRIGQMRTAIMLDQYVENDIVKLAQGDAELVKKIRHAYDNEIKGDPTNKEEAAEKIRKAYLLVAPSEPTTGMTAAAAGSAGTVNPHSTGSVPGQVRPWLQSFGLTEEDWKKFGGKPVTKE